MACDSTTLKTSACDNGFFAIAQNEALWRAVELQLLCEITTGGSGASFTAGDYGGGAPSFTPSGSTAIAVDTSNGTLWLWYSGNWH